VGTHSNTYRNFEPWIYDISRVVKSQRMYCYATLQTTDTGMRIYVWN